ncbi:VapE domain-containing protein [Rhizosphaericola mali]|nr:VapE domain-containing protein [Rhizosphaericola mali]
MDNERMTSYERLEQFLLENYQFRCNIINGIIEFRHSELEQWEELNEFNVLRQLKLQSVKASMNDLINILKSDFVPSFNAFLDYFKMQLIGFDHDFDYIDQLASYVKTTANRRFRRHLKKWLVRTVKCALEDDYVNKNALILVQEKQNGGKTTFCRFLIPSLLKSYSAENISFDKDSMIALCENYIINLDELASFNKLEINMLKAILSKAFVKERHPFERKAKKIPRRASFIGSTNRTEFLTDETGNVRWIPFEVLDIDFAYSKEINIDFVWKQAYNLYLSGYPCDLTADEIKENELANQSFTVITKEMELIMNLYEVGTKEDHDLFRSTTEIEIGIRETNNVGITISTQQLGKALKVLGFTKDNRYSEEKGYPIKAYYLKFRR